MRSEICFRKSCERPGGTKTARAARNSAKWAFQQGGEISLTVSAKRSEVSKPSRSKTEAVGVDTLGLAASALTADSGWQPH